MTTLSSTASDATTRGSAPLSFLGLACAVGVSSIYFNQPLLLEMARTFHTTPDHVGLVAMATQIGYALGLLFFVPLGDVLERRALMMRMYAAVSVALLLVAFAPTLVWLIVASAATGMMASVTHIVLPLAPDLVGDKERGRAIGIVMTGLLLGILLARTFSGWVSKIHGWQLVFVVAAVVNAMFVPLLWKKMPLLPPKQDLRYAEAMRSLWELFKTQPLLRESCAIGALAFASFSCFWTTLVFLLESHYQLGAGVAGTFGVVGAAGALVAPVAGRLSDKHGPRWVLTAGITTLSGSFLMIWGGELAHIPFALHLAILVVGVIVLDTGAQITQVANQTRIFGLVPSARSRLNTVYMTVYFGGAALGSWLSSVVWPHWQWNGVCLLALGFMGLAALRQATGIKSPGRRQTQSGTEDVALHV
jgi:predicted MFS family arabinose efflux permease